MTYVLDQTGAELRDHMKRITDGSGWDDPLATRLWVEVQDLDATVARLEGEKAALLAGVNGLDTANRRLTETAHIAIARADGSWVCGARRQRTVAGNDPTDCNWPTCGCDPYADKVISALEEAGVLPSAANEREAMIEALREAERQINYLHAKFQATGSGAAVLGKIRKALQGA